MRWSLWQLNITSVRFPTALALRLNPINLIFDRIRSDDRQTRCCLSRKEGQKQEGVQLRQGAEAQNEQGRQA